MVDMPKPFQVVLITCQISSTANTRILNIIQPTACIKINCISASQFLYFFGLCLTRYKLLTNCASTALSSRIYKLAFCVS